MSRAGSQKPERKIKMQGRDEHEPITRTLKRIPRSSCASGKGREAWDCSGQKLAREEDSG